MGSSSPRESTLLSCGPVGCATAEGDGVSSSLSHELTKPPCGPAGAPLRWGMGQSGSDQMAAVAEGDRVGTLSSDDGARQPLMRRGCAARMMKSPQRRSWKFLV